MKGWTKGNSLTLLENGEEFYPAVLAAIEQARERIRIETFIWSQDTTGNELSDSLIAAAERGVDVDVLVDGYGTPGFSPEFLDRMKSAGIRVRSFDPRPTLLRLRTNILCRLHRKIVVVDNSVALVGGLNFSDAHLRSFGEASKQDYAVQVKGPAVEAVREFTRTSEQKESGGMRWRYWLRRIPKELKQPSDDAQVLLVRRDNEHHPTDIETMYRLAIRNCRDSMIIANAYFFPGYRFIRQLCRAARRGADIKLVVQGNPDRPLTVAAASIVYADLLAAGVRIFEYQERPLHAKVAVMDEHWATVGSSNLDPVSLGLNLEANLFILDQAFAADLRTSLERLIREHCVELAPEEYTQSWPGKRWLATGLYHLTRRMWSWGKRADVGQQQTRPMEPGNGETFEAAE